MNVIPNLRAHWEEVNLTPFRRERLRRMQSCARVDVGPRGARQTGPVRRAQPGYACPSRTDDSAPRLPRYGNTNRYRPLGTSRASGSSGE